jgi:predicted amidohydrolase
MPREMAIALVQMQPKLSEVQDNLSRMVELVEEIGGKEKVDLILFPELATTGYECGVRFTEMAETVPGPSVGLLSKRAQDFQTHIAFGMVERKRVESVIYDAAVLIGPDGELLDKYHKIHLRGEERLAFRGGFRYPVMQTEQGMIGLMLGWDLAFPEVARSYALAGADLLCVLADWEQEHMAEWDAYLTARAFENAIFVAGVNRVGSEPTYTFGGGSKVVGPTGQVYAAIAGAEESYSIAHIDLDAVRQYREESQIFQCRHPQTYREIVRMY